MPEGRQAKATNPPGPLKQTYDMTIEDIKYMAQAEMDREGILSKGIRIAVLEKVKAGERFQIEASLFDRNRISAELRRCSQAQRMKSKTAIQGTRYILSFNQ